MHGSYPGGRLDDAGVRDEQGHRLVAVALSLLSVLTGAADDEGMLAGLNTTGHEIGGSLGIAVLVTIAISAIATGASTVSLASGLAEAFLVSGIVAAAGGHRPVRLALGGELPPKRASRAARHPLRAIRPYRVAMAWAGRPGRGGSVRSDDPRHPWESGCCGVRFGIAEDCGMDAAGVADVQPAVTEAATNAVLHAYATTPGDVTVTATVHAGELAIVVGDTGGGLVERPTAPGSASACPSSRPSPKRCGSSATPAAPRST